MQFTLLIHRNQDPKERKEYVRMYDDVVEAGGDVKIFSSMHVSGERELDILIEQELWLNKTYFLLNLLVELAQLTGIAAILRFPMPELEDDDDEEGNDSD